MQDYNGEMDAMELAMLKEPSTVTMPEKVGPSNFTPLKLLGSGSFGEVYLVRENATEQLYAMKVLSK